MLLGLLAFATLGASGAWAVNFQDILPGARPNGMGTAYTAVADDAYAIFYNPAGLAGKAQAETGGSVGRRFETLGAISEGSFVYARPFPKVSGVTAGAGWFGLRQSGVADKDVIAFSWAQAQKLKFPPESDWRMPFKWGANFRIISLRRPQGDKLAVGLDAGVLFESTGGFKAGLSLLDLDTSLGVPTPTWSLGLAYAYRKITFAGDLRKRGGLTVFYPGVEAGFLEDLLKVRFGKGLALGGDPQVAFGLGFNYAPWRFDTSMSLPWEGVGRQGGAYQVSLSYRFGEAPYYSKYIGRASETAEILKREISDLEWKKRSLEQDLSFSQAGKSVLEEEVKSSQLRLEELQSRLKTLEREVQALERKKGAPSSLPPAPVIEIPKPKPAAKPAPRWPMAHRVSSGDTLRSLAEKYYGDPTLWELIYKANPGKIDRGLPREGEELTIPEPIR